MKFFIKYLLVAYLLSFSVLNCQTEDKKGKVNKSKEAKKVENKIEEIVELKPKIDELKKKFSKMELFKQKPEMAVDFKKAIDELKASGITDKAKKAGDLAPDFELENANGKKVKLKDLLSKGPIVLTWYRGAWCPYCNLQLSTYQMVLDKINALGANLVAITPQLPDKSLNQIEKNKLKFEVLSDPDNKTAKKYGIVFKLPDFVNKYYKNDFKLDLSVYNGNDKNELPLAVTYVIDANGKITYAFLSADYKERAEPKEIIAALKALK